MENAPFHPEETPVNSSESILSPAEHREALRRQTALDNLKNLGLVERVSEDEAANPEEKQLEDDLSYIAKRTGKHLTTKLGDDGFSIKSGVSSKKEGEPPILPRTRQQQRFQLKMSEKGNMYKKKRHEVLKHSQAKARLILDDEGTPLPRKEVRGRLAAEDNTIFERMSVMSASRGARKAHKKLGKIEAKLRKIAKDKNSGQ